MKWGIVLDSGCDIKEKDFQNSEVDFTIVPLKVIVDDQEFVDNGNVDISELLKAMKESKLASQTACPSPGDFFDSFMKSDNILCFTLTGGLSGTYNSARVAKDLALTEDKNKNIFVCDTKSVGGHLVLMAKKGLELIHSGKSFDEIVEELEKYNKELGVVFTLGSYDNLIKTGRMSNFAGKLAGHLNIRMICGNTEEGTIEVLKKCRGEKATYNKMIEVMKGKKDLASAFIYISHCNNEKGAAYLREKIQKEFPTVQIEILKCGALTTFYAQDGGLLITF